MRNDLRFEDGGSSLPLPAKGTLKMGKRREPRKPVELRVRIFGTDAKGNIFSENVSVLDVSQNGARLAEVHTQLKMDETIGVTYGKNKVHYRVKWIGAPGTPIEGQVGVLNLSPQKLFRDFPLAQGVSADNFRPDVDRRRFPRVKCSISVEIKAQGQPTIWGRASDLSLGGCFVEMPIPLAVGTTLTWPCGLAKPSSGCRDK
jgi:PilZ domain